MGSAIFWIIFAIFVIGSIVKNLQKAGQKGRGPQPPAAAPPQGRQGGAGLIRQFLEEMAQAQGVEVREQQQVEPPAPVQAQAAAPVQVAAQVRPQVAQREERFKPLPSASSPPAPSVRAPAPEPAAGKRRRRKKKARPAEQPAAVAPARRPRPKPAPAVPDLAALDRSDLRKAIVWSEIVGLPVTKRRRVGHRPPTLPQ